MKICVIGTGTMAKGIVKAFAAPSHRYHRQHFQLHFLHCHLRG